MKKQQHTTLNLLKKMIEKNLEIENRNIKRQQFTLGARKLHKIRYFTYLTTKNDYYNI